MTKITGIKALPDQSFNIVSPNSDGTIYFTFHFRPRVRAWFADITLNDKTVNGLKLVYGLDCLIQYCNTLKFGMAVISKTGLDPMFIDDFSTDNVIAVLWTSSEADLIKSAIEAGTITE